MGLVSVICTLFVHFMSLSCAGSLILLILIALFPLPLSSSLFYSALRCPFSLTHTHSTPFPPFLSSFFLTYYIPLFIFLFCLSGRLGVFKRTLTLEPPSQEDSNAHDASPIKFTPYPHRAAPARLPIPNGCIAWEKNCEGYDENVQDFTSADGVVYPCDPLDADNAPGKFNEDRDNIDRISYFGDYKIDSQHRPLASLCCDLNDPCILSWNI